jgi:hypothetical protein
LRKLFQPDRENPTREDVAPVFEEMSMLEVPWVDRDRGYAATEDRAGQVDYARSFFRPLLRPHT